MYPPPPARPPAVVMRGKGRLPVADYSLVAEVMDRLTTPAAAAAAEAAGVAAPWSESADGNTAQVRVAGAGREAGGGACGVGRPAANCVRPRGAIGR